MSTTEKKESIKVLPFHGDESGEKGYSSFEFFPKAEVFAKKHGYLYLMEGMVAILVPTATTALRADQQKIVKLEAEAMECLLMTCRGDAFAVVHPHDTLAKMWSALTERHKPSKAEDLVMKATDFEDCRMETQWSDSFLWILEMERLDREIDKMGGSKKTDAAMQATIIVRLPKELYYKPVITKLYSKIGTTGFTRNEFVRKITAYYKAFIKPKVDSYTSKQGGRKKTQQAVYTEQGGKPWQQFKGKCHNCGKQGHKATNCPDKKGQGGGGFGGGFKGKCYGCGEVGHVKAKCPKNNNSGSGGGHSGMFVGVFLVTSVSKLMILI